MELQTRRIGTCAVCGIIREVQAADFTMPPHAPIQRGRKRCSGSFLLPSRLWLARGGRLLSYLDPRTGEALSAPDDFDRHIRRR